MTKYYPYIVILCLYCNHYEAEPVHTKDDSYKYYSSRVHTTTIKIKAQSITFRMIFFQLMNDKNT